MASDIPWLGDGVPLTAIRNLYLYLQTAKYKVTLNSALDYWANGLLSDYIGRTNRLTD